MNICDECSKHVVVTHKLGDTKWCNEEYCYSKDVDTCSVTEKYKNKDP